MDKIRSIGQKWLVNDLMKIPSDFSHKTNTLSSNKNIIDIPPINNFLQQNCHRMKSRNS